jgi:hypothetical protein
MKSLAKGRELRPFTVMTSLVGSESRHEDRSPSIWKVENLSNYTQAQDSSVLFGLVESIRGG